MKIEKDNLFLEKKNNLKSTISFLKAIKEILPLDMAIEVSNKAASNYMISIYEDVLEGTNPDTQQRFDRFREFYEAHPKKSPYCDIMESSTSILKVRFNRCPHAEILMSEDLFQFANSSCLSDNVMTDSLLPGIVFSRESSIVNGSSTCIMKWEKLNKV